MQVTNIRVSFLREKQPAQYEKAQPFVEFAATVDSDDDHAAVARKLLTEAVTLVYNGIGFDVPEKVADKLASGEVPEGATVETSDDKKADDKKASGGKGGKRGPGRPKGSKDTAPRKPKDDDKTTAADDDIPGDDDKGEEPQIRTNPEDRKNPEDDDIPGDDDKAQDDDGPADFEVGDDDGDEDEAAEENLTAQSLHDFVNDSIKAEKLTVKQAKQMQREMGVARIRELDTPEKLAKAKKMIEAAIKANAAK